jgi:hypothetical protein
MFRFVTYKRFVFAVPPAGPGLDGLDHPAVAAAGRTTSRT